MSSSSSSASASASASPLVTTNGRSRSQTSHSSYPPSSNVSATTLEHGNSFNNQHGSQVFNGGYPVSVSSSDAGDSYENAAYTPSHNEQIVDRLYNYGFMDGAHADTILSTHGLRLHLHALIISKASYLAHLISSSPKQGGFHHIYLPTESFPEITDDGLVIAIGYLYSSASRKILKPTNARAVLSAGCLLGGMDDLCDYAYKTCRDSITVDAINEWVEFVDSLFPGDGTVTPTGAQPRPNILGQYAQYAYQLRSDVFNFLVAKLPTILDESSPTGNGRDDLLKIFSRLGFDLFKSAVESPEFKIGTDQERFRFAKAAIELRRRTRGAGVEEAVVLAIGGGDVATNVHVTRKTKKKTLWRVGE